MRDIMLVAAGGAVGAALRFSVGTWWAGRLQTALPVHTLAINIIGSLLLGLLMALSIDRALIGPSWRLLLGTGLLGGFTTFSTFSYETIALVEQGQWGLAGFNVVSSAVLCVGGAAVGLVIGRAL